MLIDKLRKYKPYNEEEQVDKEAFITFLEKNDDAFLRSNLVGHITSSSWIVNKERTKVLMVYHNIYDSWSWTGGHADGDTDLLHVALKECTEETGIKNIKALSNDIYSIEVLTVDGHYKKGKYVSSHLHFNITYLLEASEEEKLKVKIDENKGVKWINITDLENEVRETWMYNHIYKKLNDKLVNMGK